MKEFFAVDVHTAASESTKVVARCIPKSLEKEQEDYTKKMNEYEKKAQFPTWLGTIRIVSLIMAIFLLASFFLTLSETPDGETLAAERWISFGVGIGLLAVGCALTVYRKHRAKKVAKDKGYLDLINSGEKLYNATQQSLKIPQDAKKIDVFLYVYSTKTGKEKPISTVINYVNTSVKAFVEDDNLMIADMQVVFALKREWFKGFEIIENKVTFNSWNKAESTTSEKYRSYGIKVTGTGIYSVKKCIKVILEKEGEQFAIVIPPYDSDAFLKLAFPKQKNEKGKKK